MQLTIDVDKNFIENLKQEFHTTNIKDALAQLLDFYKQTNNSIENSLDVEITNRVESYKDGSLNTKEFQDGLKQIRENILAKI